MKINYVEHKDGTKLFSFNRHDYKAYEKDGQNIMIDGGFYYFRYMGVPLTGDLSDLIVDIREVFTWGNNYDKNMLRLPETVWIKLKDMTSDHIKGVIQYFKDMPKNRRDEEWEGKIAIFKEELKYRAR
jgi:hypothetical protein